MLNQALKAGGTPRLIKGAQSALVPRNGKLSQLKIRPDKTGSIDLSVPEVRKQAQTEMAMAGSVAGYSNVKVEGEERFAKHKGRKGITNAESISEFQLPTKKSKKKEQQLRSLREAYDDEAVRGALDDLGAYDAPTFAKMKEDNRVRIQDLKDEIARKNKEAGKKLYSLGHIQSLESGGLHVRENMVIEPFVSTKDRKSNSARSSKEDITDLETYKVLGVPVGKTKKESWKIWVSMQLFPELRGLVDSGELNTEDVLDIMGGVDWQTALDKRQALNSGAVKP